MFSMLILMVANRECKSSPTNGVIKATTEKKAMKILQQTNEHCMNEIIAFIEREKEKDVKNTELRMNVKRDQSVCFD